MRIIGLDLSLASTGVAGITNGTAWVDHIRFAADDYPAQLRRIRAIRSSVLEFANIRTHLVVVEGLANGSQTGQHLTRAGLWHIVVEALDGLGVPWVEVAPAAVKKYATGKGNAGKDEVLAAVIRRYPTVEVRGNDEADALTLAAMGADWLGHPPVAMPAANRAALEKVRWPALMSS